MAITLNALLKVMVDNKASDTHIRGDAPVFLRINGVITQVNSSTMTAKEVEDIIFPMLNPRLRAIFNEKHEVDFSVDGDAIGRFRFNVYMQKGRRYKI